MSVILGCLLIFFLYAKNDTPIFTTIEEAVQTWEEFLNQLYNSKQLDSFTKNASKSIRQYVLEDAPE